MYIIVKDELFESSNLFILNKIIKKFNEFVISVFLFVFKHNLIFI